MPASSEPKKQRLALRIASHPKIAWVAAILGFLLTLPLVATPYFLDDRLHTWVLSGGKFPGGPHGIWDLYRFADGGPETAEAIRKGIFPWWASTELKLSFFRPLPSLWRAADHALWGSSAVMPHVEVSIVYAVLILLVAKAYRLVFDEHADEKRFAVLAGLATLMFAIDDAHSMVVLWISNRYSLLVAVFVVASLVVYLRGRGSLKASLASAGFFALALASGETSLGAIGYLAAFAWFLGDKAERAVRLKRLAPHGILLGAWAIIYKSMGYGGGGSGFYIDPLHSPVSFITQAFERLPRLIVAQFLLPPSELWATFPDSGRVVYGAINIALVLGIGLVLRRFTRHHPAAPAFAIGALGAMAPTLAMIPDDRMLLLPGLGAFGLLSIAFCRVWDEAAETRSRAASVLFGALAILHLVLAPVLLPLRAFNVVTSFKGFVDRGVASMPPEAPDQPKTLVVLATPEALFTAYIFVERTLAGSSFENGFILSVQDAGETIIERTGPRQYVMRNEKGLLAGKFTKVYGREQFQVGQTFAIEIAQMEILELGKDARPNAVRFTFERDMDSFRWVIWKKRTGFVEVPVIAEGTSERFPTGTILEEF